MTSTCSPKVQASRRAHDIAKATRAAVLAMPPPEKPYNEMDINLEPFQTSLSRNPSPEKKTTGILTAKYAGMGKERVRERDRGQQAPVNEMNHARMSQLHTIRELMAEAAGRGGSEDMAMNEQKFKEELVQEYHAVLREMLGLGVDPTRMYSGVGQEE